MPRSTTFAGRGTREPGKISWKEMLLTNAWGRSLAVQREDLRLVVLDEMLEDELVVVDLVELEPSELLEFAPHVFEHRDRAVDGVAQQRELDDVDTERSRTMYGTCPVYTRIARVARRAHRSAMVA